jgi:hypothetical protein
MRWRFVILLTMIFVCCKQQSSVKQQFTLKDSLVKRYLASIDSLDYYDTTNQDYKMLRAYVNNDTIFFANMKREMDMRSQYIYPPGLDSRVFPKKLSDMQADEAYRFTHQQSFCRFGQAITITRSGVSIALHYAEFVLPSLDGNQLEFISDDGKHYVIKSNCVLIKEFTHTLQQKDWKKLEEAISYADYWGLKEIEYDLCLDGSNWQIDAYTNEGSYPFNQRAHSVRRHCKRSRDFVELGRYFLKLSGNKTMCGKFF